MNARTLLLTTSFAALCISGCATTAPQGPDLAVASVRTVNVPTPTPCIEAGKVPVLADPPAQPATMDIEQKLAWLKLRDAQVKAYVGELRAVLGPCQTLKGSP